MAEVPLEDAPAEAGSPPASAVDSPSPAAPAERPRPVSDPAGEGVVLGLLRQQYTLLNRRLDTLGQLIKDVWERTAGLERLVEGEVTRLRRENEGLNRGRDELLQERDDLSEKLRTVLERLATSDPEAFTCTSPEAGPQHHRLVLTYRQLKQQHLQGLGQALHDRLVVPQQKDQDRRRSVARYESLLSRELLTVPSNLLRERLKNTGALLDENLITVGRSVRGSVRKALQIAEDAPYGPGLLADVDVALEQALALIRDMLRASPQGKFQNADKGAAFDPKKHQSANDPPRRAKVAFTIFPGYAVPASKRLWEPVLVWTAPLDGAG